LKIKENQQLLTATSGATQYNNLKKNLVWQGFCFANSNYFLQLCPQPVCPPHRALADIP
jgi:hypothetical protein